MNSFAGALELMAVGMCTVFVILIVVIQTSKLLIAAVNRFAPEEKAAPKKAAVAAASPAAIPADVMAVIDAAVAQVTGGKGHAAKVTRL